jgi:hypothetical protein
MIVSVHIPKTAGSSFKDLLIRHLGQERVCLRYGQTPLRYRAEARPVPPLDLDLGPNCAVVHGHFVADRLILPPGGAPPRYVVWLRHPVERLISHYFFWKRQPYLDQPLCRRMHEQELSVEAFAALDGMRDLQRFFLGGLPPDRFAFVGVTERFAASIDRFNATFGTDLHRSLTANVNPDKPAPDYRAMVGERAYNAIAELNAADMAVYQWALASYI